MAGFLLSNYYFAPPIHTFTIANARDVLALVAFLVVAGVVSALVDQVYRRNGRGGPGHQRRPGPGPHRRAPGVGLRRPAPGAPRRVAHHVPPGRRGRGGPGRRGLADRGLGRHRRPQGPGDSTTTLPLTDNELLVLKGPSLPAEDREILAGFAAQLSAAIESRRLHAEAAGTDALVRANELRTALLAAVSHDLRTPLASIKAATTSLLSERRRPSAPTRPGRCSRRWTPRPTGSTRWSRTSST